MKLLIHDLKDFNKPHTTVISNNGKMHPCICCFGCWIKTPGRCVINDGYNDMGLLLSKTDHFIVISQCFYGSYSPFIHNVFDRSIPYLLPYFKTLKNETHHKNRYINQFLLSVYFYGKITSEEKETAQKLVRANGVNFNARKTEVYFYDNANQIQEVLS